MSGLVSRGGETRLVTPRRLAWGAYALLTVAGLLGGLQARQGEASEDVRFSEASAGPVRISVSTESVLASKGTVPFSLTRKSGQSPSAGFFEGAIGSGDSNAGPGFAIDWNAARQGDPPPEGQALASPLGEGLDLRTWGTATDEPWTMQVLPDGLIYRSYMAGVRESRLAGVWNYDRYQGWIWDIALGGRVGLLRYGTSDAVRPEGWQLDLEGAAFPRLDMEHGEDLVASDFRAGVPLTYGNERFQTKLAFYHLSSHLGDEYMVRYQTLSRINYSRNALVWGNSLFVTPSLRVYGEAAWSFYTDGGAKPWEFQVGLDYSPLYATGLRGAPFVALNGYLREEVDFGGNFVVQTGWQWRGESGQLFRMGMQYFTGSSEQFEIYTRYESKVGIGLWYDF